jgi:hypothetical protein
LIAVRGDEASELLLQQAGIRFLVITFDRLLANGVFGGTMQKMLRALENAYCYPVVTEFTVNFRERRVLDKSPAVPPYETMGWGVWSLCQRG